ncbi:pentapeptide repeat-containing protein [Nostoc sp.]
MANEEHLAILKEGVEIWNEWRQSNLNIIPDLSQANLSRIELVKINFQQCYLQGCNFDQTNLTYANLSNANLINANLCQTSINNSNVSNANFSYAKLVGVEFIATNLTHTNFNHANLMDAELYHANFGNANLTYVNLTDAECTGANLSGANLSNASLIRARLLETDFTAAAFTGTCIEDWHINSYTKFTDVICDYIYLCQDQQERRPSNGNFAPGEFTKLFQKSLETVDLIFRNGIYWDAFAYSFKKLEVENQGAQLDVQSIEKKGDGILVVRVAVAPDADKAKIHSEFMQGYEFASKALEAQYQTRLEDKDTLISKQEAQINRLFDIVEQQGSVQKALVENPRKVSNYNRPLAKLFCGMIRDFLKNVHSN